MNGGWDARGWGGLGNEADSDLLRPPFPAPRLTIQKNALPALTQNPVEFKQVRDAEGVVWRRSGSTDSLSHPFDGYPVLNVADGGLSHDDSSLRIQCFPPSQLRSGHAALGVKRESRFLLSFL